MTLAAGICGAGRRKGADLYYYRARYYSPRLGRFLQTDPVGIDQHLNLYAFANADPGNLIDSMGEAVEVIRDGNRVTLNFHIKFEGARATPANIKRYSNAIREVWTNTFGKYQVTANVMWVNKNTPPSLINRILVRQNSIQGEIYRDFKSGWIGENISNRGVAHEAGHLASLKNVDLSDPNASSDNPDIMGDVNLDPTENTIDQILEEAAESGTLTELPEAGESPDEESSGSGEWSQFDGRITGRRCTSIRIGCGD